MINNDTLIRSLAYDLVYLNDTVEALANAICIVTNGSGYTVDYSDDTIRVYLGETNTPKVTVNHSGNIVRVDSSNTPTLEVTIDDCIGYNEYTFRIVNADVDSMAGYLSKEEIDGNYYQPYVPVYVDEDDMSETSTYRQLLYAAAGTVGVYPTEIESAKELD